MPVDKGKALELKLKGNTYAEIAAIQEVSPQAIHQSIKHLLPNKDTKVYQDHRSDILSEIQRKLLVSVDDDAIQKASLLQRMTSFAIVYDKERIEKGLSSGNFVLVQADLEQLRQAKQDQEDTQEDKDIIDV